MTPNLFLKEMQLMCVQCLQCYILLYLIFCQEIGISLCIIIINTPTPGTAELMALAMKLKVESKIVVCVQQQTPTTFPIHNTSTRAALSTRV